MPIPVPGSATLSAMITPALFMTANGSLIISTSNRMSRIVDRLRQLNEQIDSIGRGLSPLDYTAERSAHIADQIGWLEWRSDRIRIALTTLYLAFSTFVGTSLALAVDVIAENRLWMLPTGLAVMGVILMLISCLNLVREAWAAVKSNRLEVKFYRDLQQRRRIDLGHV